MPILLEKLFFTIKNPWTLKTFFRASFWLVAVAVFAAACKPSKSVSDTSGKKGSLGVAKPSLMLPAPELAFEELMANIPDKSVRESLQTYRKGGMYKPLTITSVTPDEVIKTAKSFIGTPHKMGGTTKKGIDCSGLIKVSLGKHGIDLPHNSDGIGRYGELISHMDQLQKGDLVFFINTYKTHYFITHSGIYLGNGEFIHASSSRGVMISSLNDPYYWQPKYIFGKRIFE